MSPEQQEVHPPRASGHAKNGQSTNGHATKPTPALAAPTGSEGGAFFKVATVLLGGLCGLLVFAALLLWLSARDSERAAERAAAGSGSGAMAVDHGTSVPSQGSVPTASFAGMAPANAADIAMKHVPFPAELPALTPGPVLKVTLPILHKTIEIAPGVKYDAWTFGPTVPGPVIHARQGQKVEITLRNDSPMAHSVDFHAARVAPNVAFADVAPGESYTWSFTAGDPGVFMYHCGTKPVLAHIANGMYGAIVVEPATPLPPADKQYVLVSSDWYLNSPGLDKPAALDMTKANLIQPDWVTWNGYAGQYVQHPLTADPGDTVRFWVMAAGPNLDTDFHVVGTLLNRAWVNQDMSQFQKGVQTVLVPAGGGASFDVKIDIPGLYPFVSHRFSSVNLGQVGLLKIGEVEGSMSH